MVAAGNSGAATRGVPLHEVADQDGEFRNVSVGLGASDTFAPTANLFVLLCVVQCLV